MAEVLLRILDGEHTEGRVRVMYAHPSVHTSIHTYPDMHKHV